MPYINVDEAYILDNTGLQVDQVVDIPYTDAALTDGQKEQARKNIGAGGTNPNLLDNPFFTVNQRSASNITGSSGGTPSVDRWLLFGSGSTTDLTVTSNGVSVHSAINGFAQRMPSDLADYLDGKTVTLSVMDTSGEVASGSLVYDKTTLKNTGSLSIGSYTCALYAGKSGSNQIFSITTGANTIPLRAAKLELGSVSTLANDTPPDYGTELAKCQYYCRVLTASALSMAAVGMAVAATEFRCAFPFVMRTMPTVTFSGTIQGNTSTVSAISTNGTYSGATSAVGLRFTTTGLTASAPVILYIGADAKIILSADL